MGGGGGTRGTIQVRSMAQCYSIHSHDRAVAVRRVGGGGDEVRFS